MMEKMRAPVILFTYDRLEETKQVINNLLNAEFFNETDIYIFSDGEKNIEKKQNVEDVRNYLKKLIMYENIKISYSEENKGLAESVIVGVSKIINQYGKAIILEDDLLISKDYLKYMNHALDIYKDRDDIWSISGFSPNIKIPEDYKDNIYLTLRGCSWGWGTWKSRWNTVDWEVKDFKELKDSKKRQKEFNISGNDMFKMLELQMLGKINSWAIRWCYSQFKQRRYTIYPTKSKIKNIGFGEDATHGGVFIDKHIVSLSEEELYLNPEIKIDNRLIDSFKSHNDLNIFGKIGYFLKKYNLGYKSIRKIVKEINNIFKV